MSDEWRSRLPTVESQFAFLKLQSIDSGKLEHLKTVFGAKMKELELKEDEDIDEPSAMLILKDFEKDLTVTQWRAAAKVAQIPLKKKRVTFLELACVLFDLKFDEINQVRGGEEDVELEEAMGDLLLAKMKKKQANDAKKKIEAEKKRMEAWNAEIDALKADGGAHDEEVKVLTSKLSAARNAVRALEKLCREADAAEEAAKARRSAAEAESKQRAASAQAKIQSQLEREKEEAAAQESDRKAAAAKKVAAFKNRLSQTASTEK